jgi:hypothetical protein
MVDSPGALEEETIKSIAAVVYAAGKPSSLITTLCLTCV